MLLIVLAYGSVSVVNVAAAISLLPRLVEPRHLQRAHARVDGADAVSATAGPTLGGLLVSAVGGPLAVLVDSLSYVYSALTLRRIVLKEPATLTGVTARGLLREVAEGVRWIYRVSALELSTHLWFAGHAVVGVVLAPYVLRTLDLSAQAGEDLSRSLSGLRRLRNRDGAELLKQGQVILVRLGLSGEETFAVTGVTALNEGASPREVAVSATGADGSSVRFMARLRIDTPGEADYYRHGGIMRFVLRSLLRA